MRKLALDLGTVSCGFAISDPFNMFAIGLNNLRYNEGNFEMITNQIDLYLQEYDIDEIILGYPLRMTNTKSQTTLMVEEFAKILENKYVLAIKFVDERETTKQARAIMNQASMTRKKQKKHKDSLAAQLILERYLN